MKDCDAVQRYVARLRAGHDPEAERDLFEHISHCERCRDKLRRLKQSAGGILLHHFEDVAEGEHLSDLDLAVFVSHGLDATNADRVVSHLSRCRECREQFRQIQRLVEQHGDLICGDGPPESPDRSLLGRIRLVLSDIGRIGRALGSFAMWFAEWAVLLIVLFQVSAAYLANPNEIGQSPATEFLGILPRSELRLWAIAAVCIAMAFLFRWLGTQLYQSAVDPTRRP